MHPKSATSLALTLALTLAACGGGSAGLVDGTIIPCNQGDPSFDVWRADFDPTGKQQIIVSVDTIKESTSAEFRLVVACDGDVVVNTTGGAACNDPPPPRGSGNPQCPFATIDVADLGTGRVECLAEITTTEPLEIGAGLCADPAVAEYDLVMRIDNLDLALDLAADDCRDDFSCLERQFGIDVGDDDD